MENGLTGASSTWNQPPPSLAYCNMQEAKLVWFSFRIYCTVTLVAAYVVVL
jgi:hypothetical protein